MQGIRVNICDHRPGLDFFADWIASETHFGTPALTDTSAICEHLRLRGTLSAIPRNPRTSSARIQVPSPQTQPPLTQASNALSFTESGTQTEHQASQTANQTQAFGQFPHSSNPAITASANTALGQAVPAGASAAASPAAKDVSPPAIEQAPSSTPLAEPATPPEALEPPPLVVSPPVGADESIETTAASGPQIPSHSSSASRRPRSRTQIGRSSYELLWREYLALTAEDHYQQQQQQRAAGHWCTWRSLAVSSNNNDSTTINNTAPRRITDMAAQAPSTVVQGPMSYDQPKGLDMLFLQLLCPPTDFLDVQKLTKLLIRIVIAASLWMFTVSFAILPAWLWLLRHELIQGHNGDCAVVLVLGLIIVLLSDWMRVAVDRADSARCAGVFTASTRSAYQLSPAIRTSSIATGQSAGVSKPAVGAGGPASHTSALANPAGGAAAGGGLLPSASRSQPSRAANAAGSSPVISVDPLVRQVKQRIIRLERILFGNELTEADISRDALSSRVQMLCTEVGVPFGGPGGSSSSRSNAAELDQQLRAVESALGVI